MWLTKNDIVDGAAISRIVAVFHAEVGTDPDRYIFSHAFF
jgi:hypothetical protein